MDINRTMVTSIAKLARLSPSDEEVDVLVHDIARILEYFAMLSDIDTSNVVETTHVGGLVDVMRPDVAAPSFPADVLLANAPDTEGAWLKTPKILDED